MSASNSALRARHDDEGAPEGALRRRNAAIDVEGRRERVNYFIAGPNVPNVTALSTRFDPDQVGPVASDAIMARAQAVSAACVHVMDRSDVEHLHKLRTSLRRLRAATRAYRSVFPLDVWEQLREEVAVLFRTTSPLRDIDVEMGRLNAILGQVPSQVVPGLYALRAEYSQTEHQVFIDIERALAAFEHQETLQAIEKWALWARGGPTPDDRRLGERHVDLTCRLASATELSRRAVSRSVKQARHCLNVAAARAVPAGSEAVARFGGVPFELLHGLRIVLKKLRYTCEIMAPTLVGASLDKRARTLGHVQDHLGEIHDADVLDTNLRRRLESLPAIDERAAGFTFLLADALARRAAHIRELDDEWSFARLDGWLRGLDLSVRTKGVKRGRSGG